MRQKVGIVTEVEKNEIMKLYERKLGIDELVVLHENMTFNDNNKDNIQDKIISELGKVKLNMQLWWDLMYEKYGWESVDGYKWSIDFQTCEIYLSK